MKRLYLTLGMLSIIALIANAKELPSLTFEKQALNSKENAYFIIVNNTVSIDEISKSGLNQTWDFTAYNVQKTTLQSYIRREISKIKSGSDEIGNTCIEEFGNKFYFDVSASKIFQTGFISKNGATEIVYDKGSEPVKMVFPMNYMEEYSGTFSGVRYNSSSSSKISGGYSIEYDAVGKVILPDGIVVENAMRLKATRTHYINNNPNNYYKTITYRWYHENYRYPFAVSINHQSKNGTERVTQSAYNPNIAKLLADESINNELNLSVDVYPVPSKYDVNIRYTLNETSKVNLEVYDISGKKVETIVSKKMEAGSYTETIVAEDLGLRAGTYVIVLKTNNATLKKKFIIE